MKARYDIQLMVQVSKMYHMEGLTQEKIAQQLGISRSAISMILSEAKEFGIIEINIKDPKKNVTEVSDEFVRRFGLKGCLVVPTSIESPRLINKVVASQGADFAEDIFKSHSTIGIAWGSTCYEFVLSYANRNKLSDVNVVPLTGGTQYVSLEYQLNEIVRMFAEKLQGSPSFIYAPALAESIADKELYMQSMSMKSIVEKWSMMDAAIVSAGAPPDHYLNKMIGDPEQMKPIYDADDTKVIGDICARRFNLKGKFLDNDYNARLTSIDEVSLRNIQNVICIAAGRQKVLSIIGALRTDVINYLVTDELTARTILKMLNEN